MRRRTSRGFSRAAAAVALAIAPVALDACAIEPFHPALGFARFDAATVVSAEIAYSSGGGLPGGNNGSDPPPPRLSVCMLSATDTALAVATLKRARPKRSSRRDLPGKLTLTFTLRDGREIRAILTAPGWRRPDLRATLFLDGQLATLDIEDYSEIERIGNRSGCEIQPASISSARSTSLRRTPLA